MEELLEKFEGLHFEITSDGKDLTLFQRSPSPSQ